MLIYFLSLNLSYRNSQHDSDIFQHKSLSKYFCIVNKGNLFAFVLSVKATFGTAKLNQLLFLNDIVELEQNVYDRILRTLSLWANSHNQTCDWGPCLTGPFVIIRHLTGPFVIIRHQTGPFVIIRHLTGPFVIIRHLTGPFVMIRHLTGPFVIIRHLFCTAKKTMECNQSHSIINEQNYKINLALIWN